MTDIIDIKKTKDELQKEKKQTWQREYMRKRREDPEFLAQQRKYCLESNKKRFEQDEVWRNEKIAYGKEYAKVYYRKHRDAYNELKLLKISGVV